MEKPTPPCDLDSVDECTPKSAQECYDMGTRIDEEYPPVAIIAPSFVKKDVKANRKRLLECALTRITSDQFKEKPKGPLG